MSSEDSLYAKYKHGKSISIPPTSAWSLGGIGSVPAPYPLSFKTEGIDEASEEKRNFAGGKNATPAKDILTSYRETSSSVVRSPSSAKQTSNLAQTTPTRKSQTQILKLDSTPSIDSKPTPRPSKLPGQNTFYGYTSYSEIPSFRSGSLVGPSSDGLKRPSQVTISQFDDNTYIKEDPSIATTFDPEKDKSLYDTALDLYRQFSNTDILNSNGLLMILKKNTEKKYYANIINSVMID